MEVVSAGFAVNAARCREGLMATVEVVTEATSS